MGWMREGSISHRASVGIRLNYDKQAMNERGGNIRIVVYNFL